MKAYAHTGRVEDGANQQMIQIYQHRQKHCQVCLKHTLLAKEGCKE